jgi:hypothetical protein
LQRIFRICSAKRLLLATCGLSQRFWGFGGMAPEVCFLSTRSRFKARSCPNSRCDLDRTANRKTKLAVGTPLIDGDFGKAVRVLVPQSRARRQITGGPRAFQQLPGRGKSCPLWQHGRPEARHGVAEMVDVDDLREVVRPVWPAIRVIIAWLARRLGTRFAADALRTKQLSRRTIMARKEVYVDENGGTTSALLVSMFIAALFVLGLFLFGGDVFNFTGKKDLNVNLEPPRIDRPASSGAG